MAISQVGAGNAAYRPQVQAAPRQAPAKPAQAAQAPATSDPDRDGDTDKGKRIDVRA